MPNRIRVLVQRFKFLLYFASNSCLDSETGSRAWPGFSNVEAQTAYRNNPHSFLVPIKEGNLQIWVHSGPDLIHREMCEE